jgi:hypothetical protein
MTCIVADPIPIPRGPTNLEYKVNILTKLNTDFTFPLVIGPNEKVGLWLLSRQTPGSFKNNITDSQTIALYDPRSLPRDPAIAKEYACLPSEQACNQIGVKTLDTSALGVYTFRFDSSNYLTMKTFSFNVSAYSGSIELACSNRTQSAKCTFNAANQTLSVIADEPVDIRCSIPVHQNDNHPVSAQFNFISELYGEECKGVTSVSSRDG